MRIIPERRRNCRSVVVLAFALGAAIAQLAAGQEPAPAGAPAFAEGRDESGSYQVAPIAQSLDNPYSPIFRPAADEGSPLLYLSESGAGRVVRIDLDNPAQLTPVVTEIPVAPLRGDPPFRLGPLGLEFIAPSKLAVATGGLGLGQDVVRVFVLPEDGAAVKFDAADHAIGPIEPGERSATGQGVFLSLAKIEDQIEKALFIASAGDPEQGWLLKAKLAGNRVSDLQPFIATSKVTGVASPSAVTINPKPRAHYLLVAQAGVPDGSRDSTVAYYGPASGTLALHVQTGLHDISGLAYSPTGDLYATDFAWHAAEAGGVYRLEAAEVGGAQSCRAVKIAAVARPTGLAFAPDGALYVTAFGDGDASGSEPAGLLLKIIPREGIPKL